MNNNLDHQTTQVLNFTNFPLIIQNEIELEQCPIQRNFSKLNSNSNHCDFIINQFLNHSQSKLT